jgi:aspartokinase
METVAFYRETIVKTYGFSEKTSLCLISFEVPHSDIGRWGDDLAGLASRFGASLLLISARPISASTMRLNLVVDERETALWPGEGLEGLFVPFREPYLIRRPVELIFFQGPHFGDRYGIALEALKALTDNQVPILVLSCSGSSVFLVLPEGQTSPARQALGRAFMTPETSGGEQVR